MPGAILSGVSSLGSLVGGIVGQIDAKSNHDAAVASATKAYQDLQNAGYPPDLSKQLVLQKFQQAGTYTPELEKAITLGPSQVSQISEDPSLKQAQMGALSALQQRGVSGLTAQDRANFSQLQQQAQTDTEAKRQQILQGMQQRGLGGSGAELAAQLQAAQSGAQNESNAAMQLGATASQNALQAMLQSGQLGGQIRGQEFGQNVTKGSAADQVAQFNAQQAIAQQTRNVGAQNNAQQQNLAEKQAIENANTAQSNQEAARQQQASRQYYQDLQARAQGVAGAGLGLANVQAGQAAQQAQTAQGVGTGIGQAAGALASSPAFMKAITPKTQFKSDKLQSSGELDTNGG